MKTKTTRGEQVKGIRMKPDLIAKIEGAKVTNPGNVLRHSFCSYHVSLHKDAARTAVLLTHRSPAMLYQHYRGRATAADAARYFAIAP